MESHSVGLAVGICAASGLIAYIVADLLKVPGILLYLVIGVCYGPLGLDLLPQEEVRAALPHVVPLLAAIILFEGGLSLDLDAIRQAATPLRRVLTIGTTMNLVGGTLAAYFIAGLPFGSALIFGALMTVTGPTVIMPILRRTPLVPRVRALLHWESILIDPIGVVLGVLAITLVVDSAGLDPFGTVLAQLVAGTGLGVMVGLIAAWVLRTRFFDVAPERGNLAALAIAMVAFVAGEAIVEEGGIVAATVAGLVMGTRHVPHLEHIREFKEQVTTLLVSGLFVVLAASVDPKHTLDLGWRGFAAVVVVALFVRPAAVFTCTAGSTFRWQESAAVAWIGPRGIIAAAVASLAAIEMHEHGVEGGDALQGLVFGAIAGTVLVQGLSAGWVSRALGVDDKEVGGVLLAAGSLGPPVARALMEAGAQVVLVDDREGHIEQALEEGIQARCGSLTDRQLIEHCYDECEIELMVAMTDDHALNEEAAAVGCEVFGQGRVFQAELSRRGQAIAPERPSRARQAFLGPVDLERMAEELGRGLVSVSSQAILTAGTFTEATTSFPLFRVRDGAAQVITRGTAYQPGDHVVFLEREATAEVPTRLPKQPAAQEGWP